MRIVTKPLRPFNATLPEAMSTLWSFRDGHGRYKVASSESLPNVAFILQRWSYALHMWCDDGDFRTVNDAVRPLPVARYRIVKATWFAES